MSDEGSCVTLIFYRINPKWWKEPALNLASAVCQMSNLTHCEISLGEHTGGDGQTMKHVARVFSAPLPTRARVVHHHASLTRVSPPPVAQTTVWA